MTGQLDGVALASSGRREFLRVESHEPLIAGEHELRYEFEPHGQPDPTRATACKEDFSCASTAGEE
jgi:hypothetical protein